MRYNENGEGSIPVEKTKILFADDDPEIREVVRILLESEGFSVTEAVNGREAVEKAVESIDLVILDVMMPGCSGFSACVEIRQKLMVPILFLTAKSQDGDKLLGFSSGGDDYLVKPFSYTELIARVKAMLRRYLVYRNKDNADHEDFIFIKDLCVNKEYNEVLKAGVEILCTDLEYKILLLLAKNKKKIFSARNIYESVWEEPYFYQSSNTVMVHIRNLRKKLEDDPKNPSYITNVWGKGYRID